MANPCDNCEFGEQLTELEASMLGMIMFLKSGSSSLIDAAADSVSILPLEISIAGPDEILELEQHNERRIQNATEGATIASEAIDLIEAAIAGADEIDCSDPRYEAMKCPKIMAIMEAQPQYLDILSRQSPGNEK